MRQAELGTQLMCMLQKPYKAMDYYYDYLFSYFLRDHYLVHFFVSWHNKSYFHVTITCWLLLIF